MTLQIVGLSFTYPGYPATLRGINLAVEPGRLAFLLGPSGVGKSTLLRCIAGLETPDAGGIQIASRDVTTLPPHKRSIGLLFQEPALFPHRNAWQNVAFPLRYRTDRPRSAAKRWEEAEARRLLGLVQIPAHRHDAEVSELSGGQRARVALARALAAKPQALLLDEPLANLDAELRLELGATVKELLRKERVPALWVTHDRDEATRLGDELYRLAEGRLLPV